jgi:hypothetical protein|tara:strand:- start:3428 stop:3856 length:429 start_codon:yes stop_codon:yes gene_type:complete
MSEGIAETLKRINKIRAKGDRVEELKKYSDNFAIKALLDIVYNPKIEFLLPESDPPYKAAEKAHDVQNVLKREVRKMIYFINTPQGQNLRPFKREQIFIELLESVDPDDAKMLLSIKNKKAPFRAITKDVVAAAFEGIDTNW